MPLPQKRQRRRRRTKRVFRRRAAYDGGGSSLCYESPGSSSSSMSVDEDSSGSSNSGDEDDDGGPSLRRYQPSLLDERLDQLNLPPSADGVEPDTAADRPDLIPYGEILQALTCSSFLDDDKMLRDAVAEYQLHKYLCEEETAMDYCDCDPGHNAAATYSVDDDISQEEVIEDSKELNSRRTPVDEYDELDPKEIKEVELKHALYRIKALLLLKGKAIDKLDNAALERKYPRNVIVENSYFLNYNNHEAFGWYFDSKLCTLAALTDYQRLVLFNCWDDKYQDWSRYPSLYNTAEADRDYLLYWKAITEKIKWIEDYMYVARSTREWSDISRKAIYQAIKIATGFKYIHKDLALLGIDEFLWSTRLYVNILKDLDGVFYEIWRRVIKQEKDCFAKALKEVSDLKMFPSRERSMKREQTMEEQFHLCTAGITKKVPESIARGLIAQQVRRKLVITRGYEHYARKKLKVAEYIGLIGRAEVHDCLGPPFSGGPR